MELTTWGDNAPRTQKIANKTPWQTWETPLQIVSQETPPNWRRIPLPLVAPQDLKLRLCFWRHKHIKLRTWRNQPGRILPPRVSRGNMQTAKGENSKQTHQALKFRSHNHLPSRYPKATTVAVTPCGPSARTEFNLRPVQWKRTQLYLVR